jgi:phage portal protein BeeE
MVLYGGMDAKTLSLTAKDAQLLESRNSRSRTSPERSAYRRGWLGLLEKTTSWGSGVEQMGIGFLIYTLMPHLNRFQQEINRKCFRISALLLRVQHGWAPAGGRKGRSDAFRQAIGGSQGPGWMLINEVRAKLNLPPIEDGNTLFTPSATNGKGGPSSNGEDNAQ